MESKRQGTRQDPQTPFEGYVASAPCRGEVELDLDLLKARLLQSHLGSIWNPKLATAIWWAAQEAAAEAWLTPFPFLVLPELMAEKVRRAKERFHRQESIRQTTRSLHRAA
jgi:hypothetical protein